MHLHHMIPKHSSYFDYLGDVKEDDYYKVYLTPEGHIEQHKILYQVFGDNFDKIACNGLTGKNVKKEVIQDENHQKLMKMHYLKRKVQQMGQRGPVMLQGEIQMVMMLEK